MSAPETTHATASTPESASEAKPATPLNSARNPVVYVDSLELLRSVVAELDAKGSGPLAVDAERASGFRYSQAAYLIQLHRRGSLVALIDPQAALQEDAAKAELRDFMAKHTWILHASTQDLPCLNELGLEPPALIDTELGSRLVGLPRVGLGAVVEHYLGLKLAKEHSAVDWSTRPLNQDWLVYAALDVDVLPDLADRLIAHLQANGKLEIAQQEFAHLVRFRPKEKKQDRWRGTTGAHDIKNQRGLAIMRELWNAREALAQKLDVAPGRLIPDASISVAAKSTYRSKSELIGDRGFHGRASRTYIDTWWAAIQAGTNTNDLPPLKLPHTGIPNHRLWSSKWPLAAERLKLAREHMAKIAERMQMPVENLLTPDFLRQLCFSFDEIGTDAIEPFLRELGARDWQIALLAGSESTGPSLGSVLASATLPD